MRCRFCGHVGPLEDFEIDRTYNSGAWCPYCDAFSYFNDQQEESRVFTLYMEDVKNGAKLPECKKIRQHVSPLRYPGGKTKLSPYIASILPNTVTRVVKPYCGGSSVSLALLLAGKVEEIVLNDIDPNVISLFHEILHHPDRLITRLYETKPDRDDYFFYRKSLLDGRKLSEEERAFRYLYCNRLAFSGIIFANPMGNLSARWNPKGLEARIRKIWEYRESIQLKQMDAVSLIEEEYWRGDDTLLFIDPPYYKKGAVLYSKAYDNADHEKLAWLLESLYCNAPGSHMIITYDSEKAISDLYWIPQIRIIKPIYSIANGC